MGFIELVNKKQARRSIKQLQRIRTWKLVVLLVLMCFLSATFLRLNNIGMIERRSAVVTADNEGDNTITQSRLYDLQRYVTSHMNTDMGKGIYLESGYKRDVQKAYEHVENDSEVYRKAQEICAPRFTHWSQAYVQCTISELAKYPAADSLKLPYADSYLHVFISPLWSPDFAGWSLIVCIVIFVMIIVRLVGVMALKIILRHHRSVI